MPMTPVDPLQRAEDLFTSGTAHPVSVEDARERAIRLLTDAYAYDAITEGEFEWRLGQLMQAASMTSIDAVVADLNGAARGLMRIPDRLPVTEGRITGFMSEMRRKGPWRVPERLEIRAIMCDMKVDFRYAVIPEHCVVNVKATMANVQLIVAPGMSVAFDVSPMLGAARCEVSDFYLPAGATPDLRVVGSAFMAEVTVRAKSLGR